MKIKFNNTCKNVVNISVVGSDNIVVLPNQSISIEVNNRQSYGVCVKRDVPSHTQNGIFYLTISAEYVLFDSDEDIELKIIGENYITDSCIELVGLKMYANDYEQIPSAYSVEDKEDIMKIFERKRKTQIFLTDLIEYSQGELLIAILIGIAVFYFGGWRIGLIYSFFAYWLLVAFIYLSKKSVGLLFKKVLKVTDEKTDMSNFLNSEYLLEWFSNPQNTSSVINRKDKNNRKKRRKIF